MSLLKKGASHGFSPRTLFCCICNCLLTKNSSSSTVRIFSCGHATHVQCELVENEAPGMGSSSGCPVCLPKKKGQKASKSVHREDGLVGELSSQQLQLRGSNVLRANDSHNDTMEIQNYTPHVSRVWLWLIWALESYLFQTYDELSNPSLVLFFTTVWYLDQPPERQGISPDWKLSSAEACTTCCLSWKGEKRDGFFNWWKQWWSH